jgi:holo-[acyl-carrier protein] synthase
MIIGIGTDLIEVSRIEQKVQSNNYFKQHVFSATEIAYCEKMKKPFMHFAARWAAKEAFLKAYGVEFIGNHKLHEIETIHNEFGKPSIQLVGKMLDEFQAKHNGIIHLTITHSDKYAVAFVIIEKS